MPWIRLLRPIRLHFTDTAVDAGGDAQMGAAEKLFGSGERVGHGGGEKGAVVSSLIGADSRTWPWTE